MEAREKAFLTNNGGMLLYGLSAVLVGPTMPGMISSFGLSLSQGGLISAVQNAGGFIGALLTLWIADRVSHPKAALGAFLLLAAALFGVGVAPGYLLLLISFAATGLFIRILDVMLNAHTGELAAGRSGRRLSMLHLFFSVGAFAGPLVARGIMSTSAGWAEVYRIIGIGYLLVAIAASPWLRRHVTMEHPTEDPGEPGTARSRGVREGPAPWSLAAFFPVATLGLALFFYAIHQVGLTSWVPYFLERSRGAGPNVASVGLSVYWVGIIAGRFVASRLVERTGAPPILLVGALASAVATLAAALLPMVEAVQLLLFIAGVTSGATIPLAYSVGFLFLPSRTGGVTALMALLMLAGRFLGPWVMGIVADRSTLVVAMTIPGWALLFTGALVAVVWALGRGQLSSR